MDTYTLIRERGTNKLNIENLPAAGLPRESMCIQLKDPNDEIEKLLVNGNKENPSNCPLFNYYGYVCLEIRLKNGEILRTGFLRIKRDEEVETALMSMLEGTEEFLKPAHLLHIEDPAKFVHDKADAWVELLEETQKTYARYYGFFRQRPRDIVVKRQAVDWLGKVQDFSPKTMDYMARHPEQLVQVKDRGIGKDGKHYLPAKALAPRKEQSKDIYENRVVLGFLEDIVEKRMVQIHISEENPPLRDRMAGDKPHESLHARLEKIKKDLRRQLLLLRKVLPVPSDPHASHPHSTGIFRSVREYRSIYDLIRKWQGFEIKEARGGNPFLPYIYVPQIYERYLLSSMLRAKGMGAWKVPEWKDYGEGLTDTMLYTPASCPNYFTTENGALTLYYQPVIYWKDYRRDRFGIGLYRNNACPENQDCPYYTPDFVLKFYKNGKPRYRILDAKYSTPEMIYRYKVPEMQFKYLYSLSDVPGGDAPFASSIDQLILLCGKKGKGVRYDLPMIRILPAIPDKDTPTILNEFFNF